MASILSIVLGVKIIKSRKRIILIVLILIMLSSASILSKGVVDQKVDFNFQDVELEDAFRTLAEAHQMNLITDSSVEGTVTAKLKDISFKKAVELLAKTNDLDYIIIENTILVATPERLDENFRVDEIDDTEEEEEELEEITKLFRIDNAEPEEVQQSLEALMDGLTISTDSRTSSLLVRGYEEDIASVEAIIADLDRELAQVYLEAEIISLNLNRAEELGVQWEISDNDFSLNLFDAVSGSGEINLEQGSNMLTANFLQDEGISTTLAKPKLSVLDGENAYINIGREIPIVAGLTDDGDRIIERVDVGNILDITPRIVGDDKILVEIEQELSSVDSEDFSGRGASFETTRTTTTVRVDNGETFVISGLIQTDTEESESRVPFLGDIPILGALFRNRSDSLSKQEIIVFITPEILGSDSGQEIKSPLVRELILEQRDQKDKFDTNQAIDDILID